VAINVLVIHPSFLFQFEEPEDPEESMAGVKQGILIGGMRSLVDVSALTDDSNLEVNDFEESLFCDVKDLENDKLFHVEQRPLVFSDTTPQRGKFSPTGSVKNGDLATTPDIVSRKIETSPTPKTAETADETLSSGDEAGKSGGSSSDNTLLPPKPSAEVRRSMTINVDEYNNQQFDLLLQVLSESEELTKLQVIRSEPGEGGSRTLSEVILFFSAIRGLPNLRDLILWNFIPECTDILTSFLSQHPTLQSFHLHYARGTVDKEFLEALCDVRTIRDVVLELQQDFQFSILFTSKSLKSLKLAGNYCFDNKNFALSMHLLEQCTTLQMLDMKPTIRLLGIRPIAYAIAGNRSLETLKFSYRAASRAEGGEALLDLAKALSRNSKLKVVENRRYESVQVTNRDKYRAEKLIASQPTLERFHFYYDSGYIEFNDSVEGNDCPSVPAPTWLARCGALDAWEW
jgi:hypothetical protein